MSYFRKWNTSSNNSVQSGQGNRFSTIKRQKSIDLSDPNLFPNLGETHDSIKEDVSVNSSSSSNPTEDCEYSAPVRPWYISENELEDNEKDIDKPGWITMTLADARKPNHKPVPEPEYETDDESTMFMPISKKPLKHRWSDPEPNVDLTPAQILYRFQLAVAQHDREVAALEEDTEDDIDEDEYYSKYNWRRDSDLDFSADEEYMDEEDDEEYYEYE